MKERDEKAPQKIKQTHGKLSFLVFKKAFGALPRTASPYNVREETKRSAVPADEALVRKAALMIDGTTDIPAFWDSCQYSFSGSMSPRKIILP